MAILIKLTISSNCVLSGSLINEMKRLYKTLYKKIARRQLQLENDQEIWVGGGHRNSVNVRSHGFHCNANKSCGGFHWVGAYPKPLLKA